MEDAIKGILTTDEIRFPEDKDGWKTTLRERQIKSWQPVRDYIGDKLGLDLTIVEGFESTELNY